MDQKRVVAHMRELAENELEDSPNKGPKKKLTTLVNVLERTIESGASAANMGYVALMHTAYHQEQVDSVGQGVWAVQVYAT